MTLQNDRQLLMAKRKLGALAQLIEQAKRSGGKGSGAEVRSLTRLANQLREEIARYEAVASHRS